MDSGFGVASVWMNIVLFWREYDEFKLCEHDGRDGVTNDVLVEVVLNKEGDGIIDDDDVMVLRGVAVLTMFA